MAVQRNQPYANSNFVVDLGVGGAQNFHEVRLPELSEIVVEYREGGERTNNSRKLPARTQIGPLLLRRGFGGELSLYQWWKQVEDGDANARRDIAITLLDESRQAVALWRLRSAWPSRYFFSTLIAEGHDVLYENLEVSCESLQLE